MKIKTTLLLVFFSFTLSVLLPAQVFQHSKQSRSSNEYTDALWLNESAFVVSENSHSSLNISSATLSAYNNSGDLIWTHNAPDTLEIMAYHSLVQLSDSSFGVLGYFQQCCDCTEPEPFLEIRKKSDGTLIDRVGNVLTTTVSDSPFGDSPENTAPTATGFAIFNTGWEGNLLYFMSAAGDSLHSVEFNEPFTLMTGFEGDVILSSANVIRRYNTDGIKTDSVITTGLPSFLVANNDRIFRVVENELSVYDAELDLIGTIELTGNTPFVADALSDGFVSYNGEIITRISNDAELLNETVYPNVEGLDIVRLAAEGENLAFVGSKITDPIAVAFTTIRHRHAALRATTLQGESTEGECDLEITSLTITDFSSLGIVGPFTVYNVDVMATVRNNGSLPVQSFFLNNAVGDVICNSKINNLFYNESLNPDEEVQVFYPNVEVLAFINPVDSATLNPCIFVTNPNNDIDINLGNDSHCASLEILSTSDIELNKRVHVFPNPAQNQIGLDTDLQINSYKLYDAFGKLLDLGSLGNLRRIDTHALPSGFYFLKLGTDKGELTKKIVIAR